MADILNTLVAVAAIWTAQINVPKDEIVPRFDAACTNGQWKPECPALRTKLEVQLHATLHQLFLLGEPLDHDQLRVAVGARFPYLAEFALLRLGQPQSAEDKEAVLGALDHPSPAVRLRAWQIMDKSVDSWKEGLGRWHYYPDRDKFIYGRVVPLAPDIVPNMAYYGLPALNDSRFHYRYIASGERRAVYTTKLSPEEVLDLVAKGQKVTLGAQLDAQLAAERLDTKLIKTVTATLETGKAFDADPAQIRYVTNTATRKPVVIAVSHDDVFGETAVVVTFPE